MRISSVYSIWIVFALVTVPVAVSAAAYSQKYYQSTYYSQGYYQGYYQSYYQSTYYSQSYYQGYYQTYYQGTYQTTVTVDTTASQDFGVTNAVSKSSGTFVIDHPLDPINKLLFHSFVESPDVKNFYDGIATLDENGEAIVSLPPYFEALNTDFRYQLRPIGKPMPMLHVKRGVENNSFEIGGGATEGSVSWQVTGNRKDPYILANPIVPEVEKGPGQIVDKGEYLYPEAFESGLIGSLFSRIAGIFSPLFAR